MAVEFGQTNAILSRFLIDISGGKIRSPMQISYRRFLFSDENCAIRKEPTDATHLKAVAKSHYCTAEVFTFPI